MRRPQASFEAQPRIARLLAPKMGIDPYTETGSACVCAAAFRKISCTLPGGQSRPPLQWFTGRFCKRAVEDAGPYDILLSPLQRVGNVTIVFGKGKGKRWKGGGGRGILTVLGDGAMGRRLPKEKEVML